MHFELPSEFLKEHKMEEGGLTRNDYRSNARQGEAGDRR